MKLGGRLEVEPAFPSQLAELSLQQPRLTEAESELRNPQEGLQDLLVLLGWLDKKVQA